MPLPIVNEQGQEFESVEAFNNLLIKGRDAQYLLTPHMFHGGVHLSDESVPWGRDRAPVRCIADGEVVAYRMMKQYLTSEYQGEQLRYSNSFCLVRHRYQETSPEGEKREFRYYSLYMHLCPLDEYPQAKRYRLKQARRVRHSVPSADFQPPALTLKAGEEFELVEGEARQRGTVTGQGEFEFARIKILTAGGSSAEVLATEGMDNLWLAMEDHAIEPAFTVKRPSWIYDQVEAVVTENMVGRADPHGRKGATGYPLAGGGSYSVAKGSLIQFSAHEVEWQEIGGKARQMARCRVVPMAKTVWLCVEAQNIELKRQGTSTLDKLYALPKPVAIKGGDVIGYLGRYEGPATRFGGRNEEHLIHLEVFSDDPNVEAIVGSGRWQEAGYKLVKGDSHGALVGPATDFFGELYHACDLDKDGELSAEEIWAGLKTKRTADGLFKIVAEHNSEWWAPASQAMLDQFAAVEKEPEEALLRAHEQERVLKLSWMDKPEVRSLGFSGPKVWFFYPMAFQSFMTSGCACNRDITIDEISAMLPKMKKEVLQGYLNDFNDGFSKNNVKKCTEKAHFLAQIFHESGGLTATKEGGGENQAYSPWYGRGLMQLTFKYNYLDYQEYSGVDVTSSGVNRDLLLTSPHNVLSAFWFFYKNKGLKKDAEQDDINAISAKINGGFNGYDDRVSCFGRVIKNLGGAHHGDTSLEFENSHIYNNKVYALAWGIWHDRGTKKKGTVKNDEEAIKGYQRALFLWGDDESRANDKRKVYGIEYKGMSSFINSRLRFLGV